jgi:ComF family protein
MLTMPELARRLLNGLPARCALCGAWPSRPLCEACVTELAPPRPRCRRCALPVPAGVTLCGACVREAPPLDACVAAVDYDWPWSDVVAQFKFGARNGWAHEMAALMRAAPWAEPLLEQATLLLPMPLSPARLRERGYNQAWLLARTLDRRRADASLLLRVRDTTAQSALPRAERQRNVRGAFAVEPLRLRELLNQQVLLVDDVMTSGASLFEAARTLRAAGAAGVSALVFGRTDTQ